MEILRHISTSLSVQKALSLPDFELTLANRQRRGIDITAGSYESTLVESAVIWFLENKPKNAMKNGEKLLPGEDPLYSHVVY